MEDEGVSMGLAAHSPLASFVVATLGNETDDVYFVKLESRRRRARKDSAVCRGGCLHRAAADRGADFAKMTPMSTSSSRRYG